jgi:glycosyltransferase involved in cell wall biosynthesis
VYWFDIVDGSPTTRLPWVQKINGWKRKYPNLKGRYFIKNRLPFLTHLLDRNVAIEFEKVLLQIRPDLVHSFVLYIACSPILKVMQRHKSLKWAYSSWGSDLFYFQNNKKHLEDIKTVLQRVDFLFTDCKRDISIAKQHGFNGNVLGVFPGGGGFNYNENDGFIKPVSNRSAILIKGYQGRSGKAIEVIKAMEILAKELKGFSVVVFGADREVEDYILKKGLNKVFKIKILTKNNFLPHKEILELMGKALIYIGNSNSDGMPNTLLEAIAMGAFPIQSNPGGASAEVINHGKNGFLIEDCNDSEEIKNHILNAINNSQLLNDAFSINQSKIKPQYERSLIASQVLSAYKSIISN